MHHLVFQVTALYINFRKEWYVYPIQMSAAYLQYFFVRHPRIRNPILRNRVFTNGQTFSINEQNFERQNQSIIDTINYLESQYHHSYDSLVSSREQDAYLQKELVLSVIYLPLGWTRNTILDESPEGWWVCKSKWCDRRIQSCIFFLYSSSSNMATNPWGDILVYFDHDEEDNAIDDNHAK